MNGALRRAACRLEAPAVRAAVRLADRLTGRWARRRSLSPYVLLIAEASEAGVDLATAVDTARRLLAADAGRTPNVRRLQHAARTAVPRGGD
jgi:hypothetical protein